MSQPRPVSFGRLTHHLDPFGQIQPHLNRHPRLRFMADEGDGTGAGGGDSDVSNATSEDALGDAGKQAIERMKAERNAARAEAKVWKDLGLTPDEAKNLIEEKRKGETLDQEAIEKRLRQQIENEAREKSATKFRASAVRETAATLNFIDPRDALALLDRDELARIDVDDNDDVDSDAVKKLLEDLAKRKPHLLKPTDTTVDHRSAGIGGAGSGTVPEVPAGQARIAFAYANTSKK